MLRLLLFVVIMTTGLVASLWSRFAALLTYVWFALFRPQEWMWVDVERFRLSFVIGLMLVAPSLLTGVLPNITHPISLGTIAFFVSALLAHTNAVAPAVSWMWIDAFGRQAVVTLLAITILNTERRIAVFVAVMAGSIGFHTAKAGLASMLGGGVHFSQGLGGAFIDSNGYAMAAAIVLPLLLCVWQNVRTDSPIERWIGRGFLLAVPLSMLMIVGTMSRGGLLAAGTAVVVYLSLQKRKILPAIAVAVILAVGIPFIPAPQGYFERMETIRTYDEVDETSALSRLHFWRVAVRMAEDNPLGVGLRSFEYAYDRYDFLNGAYGRGRSVHSSHFEVLAELGFFGAIVWTCLFTYAFVAALRVRRFGRRFQGLSPGEASFYVTTANALIVSMAAFVVGGAFVALALNDLTWYTFAVVAALDRLAAKRRKALTSTTWAADDLDAVVPRRATA